MTANAMAGMHPTPSPVEVIMNMALGYLVSRSLQVATAGSLGVASGSDRFRSFCGKTSKSV